MASSSTTLPLCTNKTLSSPFINSSFKVKPSQLSLYGRRNQSFKVSCNANNSGEHDKNLDGVDRRNVLLGLGGLYGAANLAPLSVNAAPIPPPDLKSCCRAHKDPDNFVDYNCCPPIPHDIDNIPLYKFPPMNKLRIRQPAHAVDEEYIAKYQLATSRMKKLNETDPFDPIGFKQQANIHCAYCNDAYKFGEKILQVHNSWLFFPFHRWYLYFYERILGTLIDDPTFALPYWNWDHPKGMSLPAMFDVEGSSLYDARRNPHVRNGTMVDLGSFGKEPEATQLQLLSNNLTLMYRQMVTNAPCPLLFFGAPYVLGNNVNAPGTIENIPHIPIHIWTGTVKGTKFPDGKESFGEDMGNFYSAGLDPVFYCHHANVDRMWNEWKKIGGKRKDLTDHQDWMNSEFFFYDELRNPYKVRIRDCLDSKKMGFDYTQMPIIWRHCRPKNKVSKGKVNPASLKPVSEVFPIAKLDRPVSFSINRPVSSRTESEKYEKEEILTFNNIQFDDRKYIRFDVFLNADKTVNVNQLDIAEFAGSYTSLPHFHVHTEHDESGGGTKPLKFQLAITELLEDIGLEDEDTIAVTLCPKEGGDLVSIESAVIDLVDC